MTNGATPPGWYQDPTGQGESRYWNGSSWTQTVSRGETTLDVPIDPAQAVQPPLPGTQMSAPVPPSQPTTVVHQQTSSSPLGAIIGVVVAVLALVVVLAIIGNATSDDEPTPGTDQPPAEQPAEEAPATEAPAEDG